MHLILRTWDIPGNCSLGVLYLDGQVWLRSIEREWKDNQPFVSCIPQGTYTLVPHESPKYGLSYHLVSEELGVGIYEGKRTHCLIHPANYAKQVQGCIALGLQHHWDRYGVVSSRKAVEELNETLGLVNGEEHHLTIIREGISNE